MMVASSESPAAQPGTVPSGDEIGVSGFLAARDTNTNADKRDHVGQQ